MVKSLWLSCEQCAGCRLRRSREWALRCMHEAQNHELNSFVTLTYAESPSSLVYRDFQLFMKRLRKAHRSPVRFFMCGEYGDQNWRPHFHALLFGVGFTDRKYLGTTGAGFKLFRSAGVERLWPYGMSSVGDVSFQSAGYVARYAFKKITGQAAVEHYACVDVETGEVLRRVPEFAHMSLKPGIGSVWYNDYKSQTFPRDYVVMRGKKFSVPRYYKRKFKRESPADAEWLEYQREQDALRYLEDNTAERLLVQEQVLTATLSHLQRSVQ